MSFNEKLSYTEHVVVSPTTDFAIGFADYGLPSDTVNVFVDDVLATDAGYTVTRKNNMVVELQPAVASGVVRLQRATNLDAPFYRFTAGAKFVAANIDANFNQILHSQQETRDGFDKLAGDLYPVVAGLEAALDKADEASKAAQEAADAAEEAAQVTRSASQVNDASGETQQQVNYNGGSKWHSRVGGYQENERVVLANGDIVKSTDDGNTNNPNSDMTGWVFTSKAIYPSFDQLPSNAKSGQMAETVSYHVGLGYGGATYIHNGSEWVIQPKNATISIEQFGAKCGKKPAATFNVFPQETTDNTTAVKSAFTYALNNGLKLIAENRKCFFFENMASLQFYGDVECDFNGALFFYSVALAVDKKRYKFLQVSGMRRKLANLEITCNGYMGYGVDFNKSLSDNQALTVEKLRVYNCRWGTSVLEPECINRIRFVNCDFTSNYYAGIYFKSFDNTYGHSAPVFFRDVICNGNGAQDWILDSDAKYNVRNGTPISVRDSANDVGQQVYFKGFAGLHWLGGQISCHGGGRNVALGLFEECNMVTIDAFDLEDMTSYAQNGTLITTSNYNSFTSESSGAALVFNSVRSVSVRSPNIYAINAPAIVKFMNNPAAYEYTAATPESGFAFTVWDLSNPANGIGSSYIHPYALAGGNGVSPIAFANAANKEAVSSIVHHESSNYDYSINWNSLKTLWQNGAIDTSKGYALQYLSNHDQPLNPNHLYNEFLFPSQVASSAPSQYANWIFCELPHSTPADGRFVIQCLDDNNNVLSSAWFAPQDATHYPISNWIRHKVTNGTRKIRYGFVNSQNYLGFVIPNYWNNSRYNDWHMTMYLVHDGNGALRNKARASYTACSNEYRNKLIHPATAITNSSAADIVGLNTKVNELLSILRTSGAIRS